MAALGYPLDDSAASCGDGTLCGQASELRWNESLLAEPCAKASEARDNAAAAAWTFRPSHYRQRSCADGGAGARCSPGLAGFPPEKVRVDSFLGGRGQASSNRACADGFLTYLPPEEVPATAAAAAAAARNPIETLQATRRGQKSCGTVSEAPLSERRPPRPGPYHAHFAPFDFQRAPTGPDAKVVTLATARHPDWREMKAEAERRKETR